jgi:hypothetical protein
MPKTGDEKGKNPFLMSGLLILVQDPFTLLGTCELYALR